MFLNHVTRQCIGIQWLCCNNSIMLLCLICFVLCSDFCNLLYFFVPGQTLNWNPCNINVARYFKWKYCIISMLGSWPYVSLLNFNVCIRSWLVGHVHLWFVLDSLYLSGFTLYPAAVCITKVFFTFVPLAIPLAISFFRVWCFESYHRIQQ